MKLRILTGLVVLVSLGILGFSYLRPSTDSNRPVADSGVAAPQTPPATSAPAAEQPGNERVQLLPVPCVPVPDRTPIVVRAEPSVKSDAIATVAAGGPPLLRLDARAVKDDGDWIQVRYDERVGWSDGSTVICRLAPPQAEQVIAEPVEQVLRALEARNMAELSTHVHPVKGLRFSPYVDIDPKRSVVLTASELPAALEAGRVRRWGSEDGSGEPITLTFADYYRRFVYDRDFVNAAQKRVNEFGAKSTTRPNIWEVYPNAIVVEAHVPGTKPESEGMDWSSLLLVFEQHDARWYLSALVHDQWTI